SLKKSVSFMRGTPTAPPARSNSYRVVVPARIAPMTMKLGTAWKPFGALEVMKVLNVDVSHCSASKMPDKLGTKIIAEAVKM
ncbi:MAG: hypothetical protein AAFQ16_12600, partial [Pseudomonadota bacterium]